MNRVIQTKLPIDPMPDLLDWVGLVMLAVSVALIQVIQARRVSNEIDSG